MPSICSDLLFALSLWLNVLLFGFIIDQREDAHAASRCRFLGEDADAPFA
jgi:hypothetical protein